MIRQSIVRYLTNFNRYFDAKIQMENQVTNNRRALPLFFTEEVFLVADKPLSTVGQKDSEEVVSMEVPIIAEKPSTEKNEIYIAPAEAETMVKEPEPIIAFNYLGGNKKRILILVNDKDNEVSTEAGNALLKNILKSVQLKKDDFALVNMAKQSQGKFMHLNTFFKPKVMLAFGVSSLDLDLGTLPIGEMVIEKDVNIIFGSNLDNFAANDKKMLWQNLQSCIF
ncbi:DNA polymerase III psi subunit [Pedobacter sp. UYP30]|uniref:hypothetical protein n=1 Tax=Pedobacter sp. UYP30 TaxID=1756400 RepID=UPI00339669AF